jgi:2-iminobutanoate/2-iminopropanoate deaminase
MKNYPNLFAIFALLVATSLNAQQKDTPVFHKSHEEKKRTAPYSDAVQVGDLFFLSGQVGMDHGTRTLVQGGIRAETEQAIENIGAVLQQHGLELGNVVKCTVILASMDDFAIFNEIYSRYFPKKPARTTFAASGIAANGKIEIDVIAVRQ